MHCSQAYAANKLHVVLLLEDDIPNNLSLASDPLAGLLHALRTLQTQGDIELIIRSATEYQEQKKNFHEVAASTTHDNDIIVVASPIFHTLLNNNAGNYRRQNFLCLDADIAAPNILSIVFADVQSAYLCGVAAGMLLHSLPRTTEKTPSIPLALIGDASLAQEAMHKAFQKGAEESLSRLIQAPNLQFMHHTLSMNATEHIGNALATHIADKDNAALIFCTLTGQAALGIHKAALDKNIYVIGMDQHLQDVSPSAESFSLKKDMGKAATDMLLHIKKSGFPVGQIQEKTVQDDVVGIIASYHNITPPVAEAIAMHLVNVTKELQAGSIVLEGPRGLCQCF